MIRNDQCGSWVRTRRWTRSPRGMIFGVVTGLAEWRGLNPGMTRLIVFLIVLFTGVFPGIAVYLALALILPPQQKGDIIGGNCDEPIDVTYEDVPDDGKISGEPRKGE